jgi:peptide deformylase
MYHCNYQEDKMALLNIIQADNPVLRKKAIKVNDFGKKFQTLVDDMIETMLDAPGVGLAAPQVAVSKRLIVVRLPNESEEELEEHGDQAGIVYAVVNPKIIKSSKELVMGVEGCLSIPGFVGEVERPDMVVITGQDRYGDKFRIKSKDWQARVFQHEIDHLEGQLFTDIAEEIWQPQDVQGDVELAEDS